jgi:hypothetical protein
MKISPPANLIVENRVDGKCDKSGLAMTAGYHQDLSFATAESRWPKADRPMSPKNFK